MDLEKPEKACYQFHWASLYSKIISTIAGFHCEVDVNCALLSYCAASSVCVRVVHGATQHRSK